MAKDCERGKYTAPKGPSTVQYVATLVCSMLMFCIGSIIGFSSPALSVLTSPDSPITLTDSDASNIASWMPIGHMVAPSITLFLVNTLGRKKSLLAVGIPAVLGWGLIAVADNVTVLCIGRFLGGISFGLGVTVVPMYLAEIVSTELRGALGVFGGTSMNSGVFVMCVTLSYFNIAVCSWVMMSIAVASTLGVLFLPESPYFLAMAGRFEEAEKALVTVRGRTDVSEEMLLVKKTVEAQGVGVKESKENEEKLTIDERVEPRHSALAAFKSIFLIKGNRRTMLINCLLILSVQWGGYGAFGVYGSLIIRDMKTPMQEKVGTTMIAIVGLGFNVVASFLIEKFGRRSLTMISGISCGICALIIAVYFYLAEYMNLDVSGYSNVPVFVSFLFIALVNIGTMPVQLVIFTETIAPEIKGWVGLIFGISGGFMSTISSKMYLMIAVTWGFGHCVPFFAFVVINWMCTGVLAKCMPETRGKSFLQIQEELNA